MENKQSIQSQTSPTENVTPLNQIPKSLTSSKKNPWSLIFLVILLLGFSITLAYKYYEAEQRLKIENNPQTQTTKPSSLKPTDSPNLGSSLVQKPYTEETDIPDQKKYVNPELGISFLYLGYDDYDKNKILTKQIGNKIYVYREVYGYDSGQYVEIFNKEPNVSLEETLRKVFFENYSTDDCIAVTETTPSNYPTSYVLANIKAQGEFRDMEEMLTKCPKAYTQTNGLSFFLMDQNHSDKFAFFSIGQYGIGANKDHASWQDTVEFLD